MTEYSMYLACCTVAVLSFGAPSCIAGAFLILETFEPYETDRSEA